LLFVARFLGVALRRTGNAKDSTANCRNSNSLKYQQTTLRYFASKKRSCGRTALAAIGPSVVVPPQSSGQERSLAMRVPRLAAQSLNRWLEQIHRPKAVSLVACAAALLAVLAGCQSQQTNPGDPFLPFMRTRVPPPGTNVPADSYYQGAPATSAPPASMPPAAGPPATTPSSMRTTPPDKYGPPGGYNLPQSSIDRSKVSDPTTGELKAGGTAIARRSLAKPAHGQTTVDTQLTAAKVTGATTAAGATAAAAATASAKETPAADSLATARPDEGSDESSADASTEMADAQPSKGAAVAFADTPDATTNKPAGDENQQEEADQHLPLTSAGQWSSGGGAPEQTLASNASTLRILGADDRTSGDRPSSDEVSDAEDAGTGTPHENELASQSDADDDANDAASPINGNHYAMNTAGSELAQSMTWNQPAPATPIGSIEPNDQNATLAMAEAPSAGVQTGWNEPAGEVPTPASTAGTPRANGSAARASQAYAYDPAYGWLRGRLEYSASQQQWKLRYIPIDGATDQFGGSVVLSDGTATQGLRAGDFVTAQGRVVGASQTGRGFSPRYEVASIEPAAGSN
jgi:hypothetical protein